jgi:hypothetical protein
MQAAISPYGAFRYSVAVKVSIDERFTTKAID